MKIAIVTGGSRGLGKNMALSLAAKNRDVILTYHTKEEEARKVVASIEKAGRRAAALQLDVSNSRSFAAFAHDVQEALRQKWQREQFDFLVNNAGIGINVPFMETTEEQFDQLMDIHSIHKPPALPVRIEKVLPIPRDHVSLI